MLYKHNKKLEIDKIMFEIKNIMLFLSNKKMEIKNMKEKISIIAGAGIAVLIIFVVAFYIMGANNLELSDVLLIIVPLLLAVGAITFLFDRIKNIKMGLPSADERAKKLHWKAGAYAYYATIWIAVGTMWYNIIFADILGFPELSAGQVVAVIVLLSALCWFALQFFFIKQGDTE